jgi:hypothetical protein
MAHVWCLFPQKWPRLSFEGINMGFRGWIGVRDMIGYLFTNEIREVRGYLGIMVATSSFPNRKETPSEKFQ